MQESLFDICSEKYFVGNPALAGTCKNLTEKNLIVDGTAILKFMSQNLKILIRFYLKKLNTSSLGFHNSTLSDVKCYFWGDVKYESVG